MRTFLIIAVAMLLPVSAMAGMTAINDSAMGEITGQAGITLDQSVQISIDYIAWGDDDGCSGTTTAGFVNVCTILIDDDGGAANMDGMLIDSGANASDGNPAICIEMPSSTLDIDIAAIRTGTSVPGGGTQGESLGSLHIENLDQAGGSIKIAGHAS